jgi:hypothetical protein
MEQILIVLALVAVALTWFGRERQTNRCPPCPKCPSVAAPVRPPAPAPAPAPAPVRSVVSGAGQGGMADA